MITTACWKRIIRNGAHHACHTCRSASKQCHSLSHTTCLAEKPGSAWGRMCIAALCNLNNSVASNHREGVLHARVYLLTAHSVGLINLSSIFCQIENFHLDKDVKHSKLNPYHRKLMSFKNGFHDIPSCKIFIRRSQISFSLVAVQIYQDKCIAAVCVSCDT